MKRYLSSFCLILSLVFVVASSVCAEEVYMFSDGKVPGDWTIESGEWEVVDDVLAVDASGGGMAAVFFGDPELQNYEISAKITFEDVDNDSRWASIIFRAGEEGEQPWSQIPIRFDTTAKNGIEYAVRKGDEWSIRAFNKAKEPCKLGEARELRVVVCGTTVEAYLDGQRLIRSSFCLDRDHGCVGLAASGCSVTFDDVTIKPLPDSKATFAEMKRQPCEVVAHRGYSGVAPENTLSAVREAIKVGATGCEFDVYASKDGHIVLMHDGTVDRTTDGKGKITELTLAELRKLDAGSWKDKKFTGEKIPTIEEALALLKDSGCIPVIEIKMEGISQKVVDAIRKADMVDQASIIAFNQNVVREVREIEPKLPCCWLCSRTLDGTPEQQVDWIVTEAKKCKANMVDVHFGMLSSEVIQGLKDRGITVWCWTVDNPVEMDALMRWGVESITTNLPNETVRLNKEAK